MDDSKMKSTFLKYERIYSNILSNIYPAKNSTGFPERNLSVNFTKAYEKISEINEENAITWFEFQFGKSNQLHVDAVIVNYDANELLVIESKRFSNPRLKIREIGEDACRIEDLVKELNDENAQGIKRIDMSRIENIYGVILADVWLENKTKIDIYESYLEGVKNPDSNMTFINKYLEQLNSVPTCKKVDYFASSIDAIENYKLLSIIWKI